MVLVTLLFDGSDFLCNRSIRVVIDGINSNLYAVNSGVPQGSVITPTLFLLLLNDILIAFIRLQIIMLILTIMKLA